MVGAAPRSQAERAGEGASAAPLLPKPPAGPGAWQAPPASAGDALEKGRSNIDAAAGGLHGKSLAGGRGGERYRG